MIRFLAAKLARLTLTVLAAVTFVFFVMRAAGDPLVALVPPDLPDSVIAAYRERFGLHLPVWRQYLGYLASLLAGDFGLSFRTSGPALDVVAARLPATLALGTAALAVAVLIGLPMGIAAAIHRNRPADRLIMGFSVFGFAMPNFFFGIILILIFTLTLGWLPSSGDATLAHYVMPTVTLGLAAAGGFARFTRSAFLEVLEQPFLRTAAAKGVSFRRRLLGHALPNAAIPLVTLLGFSVGTLIGGAMVTETVFGWPGIGQLLVVSVRERDLAVVQLTVLMIAVAMSLTNLLVDLAYVAIDPRIRLVASGERAGS